PFMPVDNADTANWSSANTGFTAKGHPVLPGTDITEMFWGYLPIPVCVEVGGGIPGFSTANANLKLPRISLMGLPDYSMTLSGAEVGDLLDQFSVLVYDPNCPTSVNCQKNLTDGGWNSAGGALSVQLGYNNGQNQDDSNRPHECEDLGETPGSISTDPKCPSGIACINIGEDMYYFVQQVEADNPQLVRYKTGRTDANGNGIYEVMSNYVEDFQVEYGVDGVNVGDPKDGMVGETEWINGYDYTVNNAGIRTKMSRIYLLVKSKRDDTLFASDNILQNPPAISNSTIAQPANGGDFNRRRLLTRTIRMRSVL
ncbi:MAG: PilW family protein, partial [Nitrospinota bacterium]|nr:PilW family protein [Nitrospinota bacterium]